MVNKYNDTYHNTIKMKPVDVKSSIYFDFSKETNDKDPKFKLVILLEYQNLKTFLKKTMYVSNWSEEVFVIRKVKNPVPWTYVISDLNGEEIVGTFYQKELQKQIKNSLELKK